MIAFTCSFYYVCDMIWTTLGLFRQEASFGNNSIIMFSLRSDIYSIRI